MSVLGQKIVQTVNISSTKELENSLEELKILGRLPESCSDLAVEELQPLIDKVIIPARSLKAVKEAYTIIANAMLLNQNLLKSIDPNMLFPHVIEEYLQDTVRKDSTYKFLLLRLLFLFTFNGQNIDDTSLKTCVALVSAEIHNTASDYGLKEVQVDLPPTEALLISNDRRPSSASILSIGNIASSVTFIEALKLAFNLLHHYPDAALPTLQGFTTNKLIDIFCAMDADSVDNNSLFQQITNFLLCVPSDLWFESKEAKPVTFLITFCCFLRRSLLILRSACEGKEGRISDLSLELSTAQNESLVPQLSLLHTLISRIFTENNNFDDHVKQALKDVASSYILPSDGDRQHVLGKSDSLCSSLLQVANNPLLNTSRDLIFDILWKMSSQNPNEFVKNFGLGFASSFLASHGIAFPGSVETDCSGTDDSKPSSLSSENDINIVTGQFKSYEEEKELPEMTEEEKLRHAERLFVLFERLKAHNIIKVENPVAVAAREGRLQEMD